MDQRSHAAAWRRAQSVRRHFKPEVERLAAREVLYAASGNMWPHPELVTLSFVPDGTNMGGPSSNLFAEFNADFGSSSAWQNVLLKAAQVWAQNTNLNFTVVADNGTDSGGGSYQQGDPGVGDVRIGGFSFGNSMLGLAYQPPPVNNYSIGGDVAFNTDQIFNIDGSDYDLFTVAMHEFGHTLGLDHSGTSNAIMYSAYLGVEYGLYGDDVSGIRSVYSAGSGRSPDAYDAVASNGGFASATDVTSSISGETRVAQITGLDVSATNDVDVYKITVPEGTSGTMVVRAQSSGLSLLAPSLKIYSSSYAQLASATGTGYLGSTLTLSRSVTAGQTYYIRVAGANTTAFGTGAYGLVVNFGSGATPTIAPPITQTANGDPLNGGGGMANRVDSEGNAVSSLLTGTDRLINSLTSNSWLSRVLHRVFSFVNSNLDFVDAYTVEGQFDPVLPPIPTPTDGSLIPLPFDTKIQAHFVSAIPTPSLETTPSIVAPPALAIDFRSESQEHAATPKLVRREIEETRVPCHADIVHATLEPAITKSLSRNSDSPGTSNLLPPPHQQEELLTTFAESYPEPNAAAVTLAFALFAAAQDNKRSGLRFTESSN